MSRVPHDSPVIRTMLAHRSVRAFADEPLPDGVEETLREVMRRGPTSSALQTYTFVFVRDRAVRAGIRPWCGDQRWVEECPLLIIACSDQRRVEDAARARGYPYRASDLRILVSSVEDLTIAMQNASLAAQSLGLGTVMIGGVSNGAKEIHDLLDLPSRVVPLLGLCVGVPAPSQRDLEPRPRIPAELVFHTDRYRLSAEREAALLAEHDRAVAGRGYYEGRRLGWDAIHDEPAGEDPVPDDGYGWTEHVARKQARTWWTRFGPKILHDLEALGLRIVPRDPTSHDPTAPDATAPDPTAPDGPTGPERSTP